MKQKHGDPKVFNFSKKCIDGKYSALLVEELKRNVNTLIQDFLQEPTTEKTRWNHPFTGGKKVKHTFSDGKAYKGHVISVVPGFGEWYNVRYDNDDSIYAYNLCEDYKQGDLQLFIGD